MKNGIQALLEEANAEIATVTPAAALALQRNNAVLVDIRDPREIERDGRVPGAKYCTRGMLEFWIDPESPYHKAWFAADAPFIFFCAGGLRSALATKTAQDMGLGRVMHVAGGFKAWKDGGLPVEHDPKSS